jgi:predicted  nucleic acid-binding Zn-ribbon protein
MDNFSNDSNLDETIQQVKQEFKMFLVKRRELILKLGNAFERIVADPESICEEIKNVLRDEISEKVISSRNIEMYCPSKWKRKTKPKNESSSFSTNAERENKLITIDTEGNQIRSDSAVNINNIDYASVSSSNSSKNNDDYDQTKAETTNKKAIDDNYNIQQEYHELLLENQKLKEELKRAEDRLCENTQKDSKINDLEAEQKQLQRELEDKTDENTELQKQIDQLKEELEKLGNNKNNVGDLVSSKDADIDFEGSISWEELRSYLTLIYKSGSPLRVWFHGRIDKQSGKVIAASPGRISNLSKFADN